LEESKFKGFERTCTVHSELLYGSNEKKEKGMGRALDVLLSFVLIIDVVLLGALAVNIYFFSKKIFYQANYQRIK
jgi:hypothetical protein